MTEPAAYDEKTTPAITLGGKKWPIPELAPRQLRHIRQALLEMNRRFSAAPKDEVGSVIIELSNAEYESLLCDPIYWALTRAHPTMTREEFDDMALSDGELSLAWFTVRNQSGLFLITKSTDTPAGDAPPGEAVAADQKS